MVTSFFRKTRNIGKFSVGSSQRASVAKPQKYVPSWAVLFGCFFVTSASAQDFVLNCKEDGQRLAGKWEFFLDGSFAVYTYPGSTVPSPYREPIVFSDADFITILTGEEMLRQVWTIDRRSGQFFVGGVYIRADGLGDRVLTAGSTSGQCVQRF